MTDMNQLIRERAGRGSAEAPDPPSDEAQAWQQLDRDARRQGWHRGGFAKHHQMRNDSTYQEWTDGRAEWDPTYKTSTPGLGGTLTPHLATDINSRMRRAFSGRYR